MADAVETVQAQLEAYNAHDVDAFLECYSSDVAVVSADGSPLTSGREAMRAQYSGLFERHPGLRADVPQRIRVDDWVVDEEHVHVGAATTAHALMAYEVVDGLIRRVVVISSSEAPPPSP